MRKKFPWVRFTVWLALIIYGSYLAVTAQPNLVWFDIAWPVVALVGVVYFIGQARR